MKEIISPGYGYMNIKYNNTCLFCGCQYTYQNEDTYINYSLIGGKKVVLCPSCGKENLASSNFLFNNEIVNITTKLIADIYQKEFEENE